ncbi:MAG: 3-hydroxyacyl-CoA dehydrogenase family protein [Chitinophagales bacterium]
MKILATGDEQRIDELKQKFGSEKISVDPAGDTASQLRQYDVIFDLNADEKKSVLDKYAALENKLVIACAVKKSVKAMIGESDQKMKCRIAGMNALPTFINKAPLEVSFADERSRKKFEEFAGNVKLSFLEVKDAIGMVIPRVICMIINEACYSLYQGVAVKEDIDLAMKLGTGYPFGPLEWCDRIGIQNVYETLEAIHYETRDRRYEICPLLKEKYEKKETFYS